MRKGSLLFLAVCFIFVFSACSATADDEWKPSPAFTAGGKQMIGKENKVGLLSFDEAESTKLKTRICGKCQFLFWGDSKEFQGGLKVVGTNKETGEQATLIHTSNYDVGQKYYKEEYGADAGLLTGFEFPKARTWKLDIYFGDKLFESIVVEVKEQ